MKTHRISIFLLQSIFLAQCLVIAAWNNPAFARAQPEIPLPIGPVGSDWTLTFRDEFDSASLNPQPGPVSFIPSLENFSQEYGFFEIRAQIPLAEGISPASWSPSGSSGWFPHVEATEFDGNNIRFVDLSGNSFHLQAKPQIKIVHINHHPSAGWHILGLDWEPGLLAWYMDGVEQGRITDTTVISAITMNPIAELNAVVDAGTILQTGGSVDYVRVWQRFDLITPTPLSSNNALRNPTLHPPAIGSVSIR